MSALSAGPAPGSNPGGRRPGGAVAITGLGILGAPGAGLDATRAALAVGRDGLATWHDAQLPLAATLPIGRYAGPLRPHPSRTAALAVTVAEAALHDAGVTAGERHAMGIALGSCTGGMRESEAAYLDGRQRAAGGTVAAAGAAGGPPSDPVYRRQHPHRAAQAVARLLGCHGPQSTHAVACASAASALIEACEWIRQGLVARVLVIGADALTRVTMAGFHSLQLIDARGCRPLSQDRQGMSLGEGAAALVLEAAGAARQRGARIHAALLGWGLQADAYHLTRPDPSAGQLRQAIAACLADADCPPAAVGYVNLHGTGTRDNDHCEAVALAQAVGSAPCASSKRSYGHTMGACAAIEAVGCVLALRDRTCWPSAGLSAPAVADLDVVGTARPLAQPLVLSTTLAFGGVNACLAFAGAERCA